MGKSFRTLLLVLTLLAGVSGISSAQDVALKTNFAHWAAIGSPNLSLEMALGGKCGGAWGYLPPSLLKWNKYQIFKQSNFLS